MEKTYWIALVLFTLAWGLLSLGAAYPDFILESKLDMFSSQKEDFLEKLIIPALLFLAIFTLDFFAAIRELETTKKRWDVTKYVIFAFFSFFILLLSTIIMESLYVRLICFFLMWIPILMIKFLSLRILENRKDTLEAHKPI